MKPYPLQWPDGIARNQRPIKSAFQNRSPGQAAAEIRAELRRLGATNVVITSNAEVGVSGEILHRQRRIDDTGVAVYFRVNNETRVMALDTYELLADNLHGLALSIEALRTIERHGSKELLSAALVGFAALPEKIAEPWWKVLGCDPDARADEVHDAYHREMRVAHPDAGGSKERFLAVREAWSAYKARQTP